MPVSPPEAFGQAIREIRNERGLSQEEAAYYGGLDRAYYGHIERASKNATLNTAWKIADALGVKISDLFVRAERILEARGDSSRRPR